MLIEYVAHLVLEERKGCFAQDIAPFVSSSPDLGLVRVEKLLIVLRKRSALPKRLFRTIAREYFVCRRETGHRVKLLEYGSGHHEEGRAQPFPTGLPADTHWLGQRIERIRIDSRECIYPSQHGFLCWQLADNVGVDRFQRLQRLRIGQGIIDHQYDVERFRQPRPNFAPAAIPAGKLMSCIIAADRKGAAWPALSRC